MGLFDRLLGPNIDKLKTRGDIGGLVGVLAGDSRAELRTAAAQALGEVDVEDESAWALVGALADDEPGVVRAAEMSLRTAGAAAGDALADGLGGDAGDRTLSLLLELGEAGVMRMCETSSSGVEAARRRVLPELIRLVQTGDASANEQIFRSLLAALGDADPQCRVAAAEGLAVAADPRAAKALASELKDGNESVRAACRAALAGIGEPAVPCVADTLRERNPNARLLATGLLGEICAGEVALESRLTAVTALLTVAELRQPELHEAAVGALAEIPSSDVMLALVERIEDPLAFDREEGVELIRALVRHGSLTQSECERAEDRLLSLGL